MTVLLYNMYFKYDDGSTTQHLNVEAHRVPEVIAATRMTNVEEYRVVKVK